MTSRSAVETYSVVVATYLRVHRLYEALESLKRQTRPPDEVVLVTKSCDPASSGVVERYIAQQRSGITWRHATVHEMSILAAERAGVAASRGDVVCFLDDDAVAREDWIARMAVHYGDAGVGGVGGRDVVHHGDLIDGKPVRRVGRVSWFGRLTGNHHNEAATPRAVDFLKGCNMSFRRPLALQLDMRLVGEITYGFEVDLGLTARRLGYSLIYDPNLIVDHYPSRQTPLGITDPLNVYVVSHNQTYAILKHFRPPRRFIFLIYTHLLGDRNTPGILRALWLPLPKGRSKREVLRAARQGKRDAWRLFQHSAHECAPVPAGRKPGPGASTAGSEAR